MKLLNDFVYCYFLFHFFQFVQYQNLSHLSSIPRKHTQPIFLYNQANLNNQTNLITFVLKNTLLIQSTKLPLLLTMNQQHSLQGGMRISAPALTAAQQRQIHQQHKKQDQLKQQKRQLELDLINFKQAAKTFQTILKVIKTKPKQKDNHSVILTNGQNLIYLLTKMKTVADLSVEVKSIQLNVLYEMSALQWGNLNIETQLKVQEGIKNQVDVKMALQQKLIIEIREQIAEVEQRLNECRATNSQPNFEDRITEFVTQILSQYPNDIDERDINLIKRLDFGALNYEILSQINENEKFLDQIKSPLLSLRHQILQLQQQVLGKQSLQQQLQTNRTLNLKNHQQLQYITSFNNHVQSNLQAEIQKQVNQRKEMLNKSHLESTDKYLMAGEYIVEGFKAMLGEEKHREIMEKLFRVKSEATGKVQKMGHQVRYEPMDNEI